MNSAPSNRSLEQVLPIPSEATSRNSCPTNFPFVYLEKPTRFAVGTPPHYRRNSIGIFSFRDTAHDHSHLRESGGTQIGGEVAVECCKGSYVDGWEAEADVTIRANQDHPAFR